MKRCFAVVAFFAIGNVWAPAQAAAGAPQVMTYTYNAPETSSDTRYDYEWTVLKAALDRTTDKYGPYALAPSAPMVEKRQVYSLMNNTGELSVMYLGERPEFHDVLTPIPIPVDKNLESYMVFLINRGDEAKFAKLRSIDDLKPLSFGLGSGWIDVDVLQANGLKVTTGASYDGLFKMLAQRRFDIFLRSAVEVLDELTVRTKTLPTLTVEPDTILYYPIPMYYWFAKTEDGKRLAARAEEGLWRIINDGTFDALFEKYQRDKIERLALARRHIIEIRNPYFSPPKPPYDDKRIWFTQQGPR